MAAIPDDKIIVIFNEADSEAFVADMAEWLFDWLEGFDSHEVINTADGITLVLPKELLEGSKQVLEFRRPKP
jgi:hypothetical protein